MSEDETKIAGSVLVPPTWIMEEISLDVAAMLHRAIDRRERPWMYPDKGRWPAEFVLFPRLRRWHRRLVHLSQYRPRIINLSDQPEGFEW